MLFQIYPRCCVAVFLLIFFCEPAGAGVIRSPASATLVAPLNENPPNNLIIHTIDQSGLSTSFTNGVTDFDTYLGGNPTHDTSVSGNRWVSNAATTGSIIYDLGTEFTIEQMAFWNMGSNSNQAVRNFSVDTSNDVNFTTFTNVGSGNANPNTGPNSAIVAEQFNLTSSTARYVRFNILSNNGNGSITAFSEIAFETDAAMVAVPEPAGITLFAIGAFGLFGFGNRWKRMQIKS